MSRILVVEDERHLAVGIKFNLEAEGHEVVTEGDGPAALVAWNQPPGFDLAILDLMLPGMSGYAVCESIRNTDPDVPVLILSARDQAADRARGFDVGADQYLTKPFELDELLSRVKNLLSRSRKSKTAGQADTVDTAPPDRFQFANTDIDFVKHEVLVGGKRVKLTALEMKLLAYFVAHEGRMIPRGDLLQHVWDMPPHLQTRAPDQLIRRLRKAFEPNPSEPRHFLTIRDVGYRFLAAGDED